LIRGGSGDARRRAGSWRAGSRLWFLPLLLAGHASAAFGQGHVSELLLFRSSESLLAEVRAQDLLDEPTTLTIESGLPGTCIFRLRLEDRSGGLVAERSVVRSLWFDLWENRYVLESEEGTLALPTLAAADSAISSLVNCDLCPLSKLSKSEEYRLTLQIAVCPLGTEGKRSLSRYVNQASAGGDGAIALDLNALFGHVMRETESSRPGIGGVSPFFRAADLKEPGAVRPRGSP
jgi:hypothetical protein